MSADRQDNEDHNSTFQRWKFPLIAFILSLYAWFPKVQNSLSPLFYVPVQLGEPQQIKSLTISHLEVHNEPYLLVHASQNLSLYRLSEQCTKCTMQKLEILKEVEFVRSASVRDLGLSGDIILSKSFWFCEDDSTFKHKRKKSCDPKFLIITADYDLAILSFELNKLHALSIETAIRKSLDNCEIKDIGIEFEQYGKFAIIFAKFKNYKSTSANGENNERDEMEERENTKCAASGSILMRFNLKLGRVEEIQQYSEKTTFRDWSFFSVSLHGEVHDWYKFDDTSVEIASVVTNDELLMGRDAADLSLSKQPTIAETYGRGKKTKIQQSLSGIDMNANAYIVKFSGGILIVNNHTLEPLTLIKLPNKEMNRSVHVIWDQEIRSIASIDIGSTLKTIGIPRIFAESRVLGQTNHVFQKLLSIQDLVGMTIEESLEELRFLQPPVVFYAEKPSKFDQFGVLSSGIGATDPKFMFHIGYGTMKSYDLDGNLQWKSESSAKWQSKLKIIRANSYINRTFKPSIAKVPSINAFVIQGFEHVSVISELNGAEIAAHSLPSFPVKEPVVFDFNSDGIDDVIIVTSQGLVGFSICPTFSNTQIWLFYFSIIVTGFLFFLGVSVKKFSLEN